MGELVRKEERGEDQESVQQQQQYLTFMLGGETYAIGILAIKEIIEYSDLTEVPMMPPYICGVINLRGSVVPVVDLSMRFGNSRTELTRRTCIVIIEVVSEDEDEDEDQQTLGVVVDAVNEVLEISPSQIEAPPAFGAKIRTDFISGMGKLDDRFVIILRVDKVLSVDELSLLEQNVGKITGTTDGEE